MGFRTSTASRPKLPQIKGLIRPPIYLTFLRREKQFCWSDNRNETGSTMLPEHKLPVATGGW
jgi:hypothetical protein